MVSEKQQVNAVNDSTITSSISWWHGWHLFHCISPMSLQDRTIFTDKQHLATDLARLPRTVSPGEQWCKLICERSEWFHKNKFDIMMAWMTPVSLHFSNVSTGSNNLYRLTTLGYWFSTFATNSLSRRTVVQINFCPPHHLESSRIYGTKKFNKVRQHHLESSRNALFHLASSWTSKLRTQFVSLTLGMGIIVEHHDAVNYMHHTVLKGNIHKGTTNPTAW